MTVAVCITANNSRRVFSCVRCTDFLSHVFAVSLFVSFVLWIAMAAWPLNWTDCNFLTYCVLALLERGILVEWCWRWYSATVARCVCNTHYSHSLRVDVFCPLCAMPTTEFVCPPACSNQYLLDNIVPDRKPCLLKISCLTHSCLQWRHATWRQVYTSNFLGVVLLPLTSMNCDVCMWRGWTLTSHPVT